MKKSFYLILGLFILSLMYSCQNILGNKRTYTENLKQMSEIFKKQLEDSAFKNNATLKVYESKSIGYDTIGDEFFKRDLKKEIDAYIETNLSIIDSWKDMVQPFPWCPPDKEALKEIAEAKKKISDLKKLRLNICAGGYRKTDSTYFLYKHYLKATLITSDGKKKNAMDTIKVVFSKNLRPIILESDISPEYMRFEKKIKEITDVDIK